MHRLGRGIPADFYSTWLPASIEQGDVYAAEAGGIAVGIATTERQDGSLYIRQLAVDPTRQRSGVGRFLLARLEEVARARGDKGMTLMTAEMMDHLVGLYLGFGFEIVRRGPSASGLDPHTRVFMEKRLSP
jgi:ribosomal protein S18 acetylase RimI-like enzyme